MPDRADEPLFISPWDDDLIALGCLIEAYRRGNRTVEETRQAIRDYMETADG